MFTGLVQSLATVVEIRAEPPAKRLLVESNGLRARVEIGDSVAVNGCCLTAVEAGDRRLAFQAGPETLARTTLGALSAGSRVNLELSLKLGDPLGGHLVAGHVDAVGTLISRQEHGEWSTLWFSVPGELIGQMAPKGSIAVDGVSLTLVEVGPDRFSVALIPHTLGLTTLGRLQVGDRVNLETDLLAKYVESHLKLRAQGCG